MQMCSGTWTQTFLKEAKTSLQGMLPDVTELAFSVTEPYLSEKQLLCMARAILKRTKVLVMDEVRVYILFYYYEQRCPILTSARQATAR